MHVGKTSPPARPAPGASLLIVLMGSLGDVARGLALVDQLKRNFSGIKISWLVEPKCEGLVRLHPQIDRVLVFRRGGGVAALRALRRELESHTFDIALDLQRIFKSGLFSWWSRAPRRIGFHRRNSKEFNWLFNNECVPQQEHEAAKLRHYLSFIEQLGGEVHEPLRFGLARAQPSAAAAQCAAAGRYLVAVLGSSWESKDWFYEGYEELGALLARRATHRVVVVGDDSRQADGERLQQKFPALVCNLTGRTSLADLASLLAHADAAFGPDSGPGHVSAAVGTPYVSLFGATSPKRVAPYGCEDLVVQVALGCMPCYRRRCPGLGRLCMRLISANLVYQKLEQALARRAA